MLSILSSRQPYVQVETHPRHIADVIEVLTSSQSCTMFSCCFLLLPPVPLLLSLPATFLQPTSHLPFSISRASFSVLSLSWPSSFHQSTSKSYLISTFLCWNPFYFLRLPQQSQRWHGRTSPTVP